TPVGSVAVYRGVLEISRTPPMAAFAKAYPDAEEFVHWCRSELQKQEARDPTDVRKRGLVSVHRQVLRAAEDSRAATAATWGIRAVATSDNTVGLLRMTPYGPVLSWPGLGLVLPAWRMRGSSVAWAGVWLPLWIMLVPAMLVTASLWRPSGVLP